MTQARLAAVLRCCCALLLLASCEPPADGCDADANCDEAGGEVCDVDEDECQIPCASDVDCEGLLCCPIGDVADCRNECYEEPVGDCYPYDCCYEECCPEGVDSSNPASPCFVACPEEQGLSPTHGTCNPVCATAADCYALSAFCASDFLCYSVSDPAWTCSRVEGLPVADADAPLIFDPRQDAIGFDGSLCAKAPETCPNNGNVCQFSFQFYDPNGDVPASHGDLYSKLREVDASGAKRDAFDVLVVDNATLAVMGCYPEAEITIETAVVLLDNAGNQSNPLCFSGSAP